jgi:hypothetical protein
VIVAICALLLFGAAAFSVDLGNAYAAKRQLSVAADAASLAAARVLDTSAGACAAGAYLKDKTAARTAADSYLASNTTNAVTVDEFDVTCAPDPANYVQVHLSVSRPTKSFLGGIFGVSAQHPARTATARIGPPPAVSGLRPFAVCYDAALLAKANPTTTLTVPLNNYTGVCNTTSPGNWGTFDFNGGANDTGDLVDWTTGGYPGSVDSPSTPSANPGNLPASGPGGNMTAALTALVGTEILMPVATQYTCTSSCNGNGGGSNAQFSVVGFIGAELCGFKSGTTADANHSSCYDSIQAALPENVLNGAQWLQIRYRSYTTSSYKGFSTCALGDATCDFGLRATQLYE